MTDGGVGERRREALPVTEYEDETFFPPPTVMTTALVEPAKRSEMEWRPLQEGPTLINPAWTSAGREIDEPEISCDRTAVA